MSQRATNLSIGGLARLSTCDWPGELAATVFCQGCAWDCPYCHNPGLRPMQAESLLCWQDVLEFLGSRRGLLDAVVFSGGEPTLQTAIFDAVADVRSMGFRVGLHTAGMAPKCFAKLLPVLNWVGFDVKAPLDSYARITGSKHGGEWAFESLRMLLDSSVPYEVRTTLHPDLLSMEDMQRLKAELLELGVTHYVIQGYRPQGARIGASAQMIEFRSLEKFSADFPVFSLR